MVKGILICLHEGPRQFPRVDNNEMAKTHRQNKKNSSTESMGQFQPN